MDQTTEHKVPRLPSPDAAHLTWALFYASLGWEVFPIQPGTKTRFYEYPERKNPISGKTHSWAYQASRIPADLTKYWTDHPDADIGVATGDRSNCLAVVDADTLEGHNVDGLGHLATWEKEHGLLPATIQSQSKSGSIHRFYICEGAKSVNGVLDGVDVKANGGYVVLPPSKDGRHWLIPPGTREIAKATGSAEELIPLQSDPEEILARLAENGRKPFILPERINRGERTDTLIRYIGSLQTKGLPDATIDKLVRQANQERCYEPLSDHELAAEVFPALQRPWKVERPAGYGYSNKIVDKLIELDAAHRYGTKDRDNSMLFADIYGSRHRYCPEWKDWAYHDGKRWILDTEALQAKQSAKELSNALAVYQLSANLNEQEQASYAKYVAGMAIYRNRLTMITDAKDNLPLHAADLDTDPYLLNVDNGVLDLRDGCQFKQHSPEYLISKLANVAYDPDAECTEWEQFMDEIMDGDEDKIRFLQKFAGICLTADTREETMLILYGPTTRNGKSTFVETLSHMLGGYAATCKPESLAVKNDNDSRRASGDIARLAGARMVVTSEPKRGMLLDAALVKNMLGRDSITARQLYEREFTFTPVFKLVMNTNYQPAISDDTIFASGRINVVTFDQQFTGTNQDKGLKERLRDPEELSGILNWCIRGLELYRKEGLIPPEAVKAATEAYRQESDKIGLFLSECMEIQSDAKIAAGKAYKAYTQWARDAELHPLGKTSFFQELKKRKHFLATATIDGKTTANVLVDYVPSREAENYWPWDTFNLSSPYR